MKTNTSKLSRYIISGWLIFFSINGFSEERIDMKGISIIGNKELPNVLYIVPWKSPDLPDMNEPPLATLIDAALEPVDRESVLRKELYYKALNARKAEFVNQSQKIE